MNPLYSRSGVSHPLGKCDTEIKAQVPERVKEDLSALAEEATWADWCRYEAEKRAFRAHHPDAAPAEYEAFIRGLTKRLQI